MGRPSTFPSSASWVVEEPVAGTRNVVVTSDHLIPPGTVVSTAGDMDDAGAWWPKSLKRRPSFTSGVSGPHVPCTAPAQRRVARSSYDLERAHGQLLDTPALPVE